MAAGIYNFTIEQGATFTRTFKYKTSDGTAIPMTGLTPRMQLRETLTSDNFILSVNKENGTKSDGSATSNTIFTLGDGTTDFPLNAFKLTIDADTTASMSFDTAVYDIEIKTASNVVTRLLQGKIKLSKEVTR